MYIFVVIYIDLNETTLSFRSPWNLVHPLPHTRHFAITATLTELLKFWFQSIDAIPDLPEDKK